ncbi:acetamidase/formamidase family protein [Actinomadura rayongensis]|uniref:acetamidase/formamidase family protein n=1 Tax=Actinomadura rayongensis TaxID=1429076 RepID=UPI00301C53C3
MLPSSSASTLAPPAPVPFTSTARAVPGHDRWHPDLPAVAEVITGGSVRLDCPARERGAEPLLCGPLDVVGAEPGDVIVVDVLALGRADGRPAPSGHPGVIGCAPDAAGLAAAGGCAPGPAMLGGLVPGTARHAAVAARAVRGADRGRAVGGCTIARLTAGSRILLPVLVAGAKLSAGDLHFPTAGRDCGSGAAAGWIDLRVHLTRRGVERFRITGPMLMPDPTPAF